jgi:hypothetical protein
MKYIELALVPFLNTYSSYLVSWGVNIGTIDPMKLLSLSSKNCIFWIILLCISLAMSLLIDGGNSANIFFLSAHKKFFLVMNVIDSFSLVLICLSKFASFANCVIIASLSCIYDYLVSRLESMEDKLPIANV